MGSFKDPIVEALKARIADLHEEGVRIAMIRLRLEQAVAELEARLDRGDARVRVTAEARCRGRGKYRLVKRGGRYVREPITGDGGGVNHVR